MPEMTLFVGFKFNHLEEFKMDESMAASSDEDVAAIQIRIQLQVLKMMCFFMQTVFFLLDVFIWNIVIASDRVMHKMLVIYATNLP